MDAINISATNTKWTLTGKVLFRFIFLFVVLFLVSSPFNYCYLLPFPGNYTSPLFESIAKWFGTHILNIKGEVTYALFSDSMGSYINTLLSLIFSAVACIFWSLLDKKRANYNVLFYWFMVFVRYYLAVMLLIYGFDKVFKRQFYLPEPNVLYTPMGKVPAELLYWSSMGISRFYTMFCGIIEIIPAILLFFRRTTLVGALIAFGAILNVVFINFGYDIEVKLLSLFLLLLSFIIIVPYTKKLLSFFFGRNLTSAAAIGPTYTNKKLAFYRITKAFVICYLLFAVLFPFIQTRNFNDDSAKRPLFHGAYTVTLQIRNGDTIRATDTNWLKRVFIHRRGYLITENINDQMDDFELRYDTAHKQLLIKSLADSSTGKIHYQALDSNTLVLKGIIGKDSLILHLKKIDLTELPALQKGFNWISDD